jgi:uncharacterized protein YndB with AHSA1/START domain
MSFQSDPQRITWRVHLTAPRAAVYELLATSEGRSRFWAESAEELDGLITFIFPDGTQSLGRILQRVPGEVFAVEYFGSVATFRLSEPAPGETELVLQNDGVSEDERVEVIAGWVSVLMQLKAAAQFDVDLRNHDPARSWRAGYVEN